MMRKGRGIEATVSAEELGGLIWIKGARRPIELML
jgi:hypothetical protein